MFGDLSNFLLWWFFPFSSAVDLNQNYPVPRMDHIYALWGQIQKKRPSGGSS